MTGNPSLTRRWPFGRVKEGLPTIWEQRGEYLFAQCIVLNALLEARSWLGLTGHRSHLLRRSSKSGPVALTLTYVVRHMR
jgi:hypothetical protein